MLKDWIKSLSAEQTALKLRRKTGTHVCTWSQYTGYASVPEIVKNGWVAASKVQDNRIRITAALNLYHELGGSEYRHGVDESDKYAYKRHYEGISKLVAEWQAKGSFVA